MSYDNLNLLISKLRRTSQFITSEYSDSDLLGRLVDAFPKVMIDIKGDNTTDSEGNLSSPIDDFVAALVVARAAVFVMGDRVSQLATQAVKIRSGQQQVDITNTASQVRDVMRDFRDDYGFLLKQYLKSKKGQATSLVLERFKKYDL